MDIRRLTITALFTAIGVVSAHLIYIPIGVAKCFPMQSAINIIVAVLLGTRYATGAALTISLLRNILGTGSLLAFPGSLFGAALAGYLYKKTGHLGGAIAGELIGTGLIGSLAAYPLAHFVLNSKVGAFFFVGPFFLSAVGGSVIAFLFCRKAVLQLWQSRS